MITREKFEIALVTNEPFRIGGKEDPLKGQDNPVTMVGEKIVVPGPSLKGALRSEIEHFLISTYYDKEKKTWTKGKEEMKPCIPSPEKQLSQDEKALVRDGKYRDTGCHYPCNPKPNRCNRIEHSICPACYLLGANGINGFVRVPFLTADLSLVGELYSARLDRSVGTVRKGTNRPYSLVSPETRFQGIMEIITKNDVLDWTLGEKRKLGDKTKGDIWLQENEWTEENIIQTLLIDRLTNIEFLGGYKSKGCGRVQITVRKLGK